MLKHTVLSLLLLATVAVASEVKSSTSAVNQDSSELTFLEEAKTSHQRMQQYVNDYIDNKEGVRARFEEVIVNKGSRYVDLFDIESLLRIKFDEHPENTSLETHPINNINETDLLIALYYSKTDVPLHVKKLIFQKIKTLGSEKPRVKSLLGMCYFEGFGCERDDNRAIDSIMDAAFEGDVTAKRIALKLYLHGWNKIQKNLLHAYDLAKQLITEHSCAYSHQVLGDIFDVGEQPLEKCHECAFYYYRMAAAQGYERAQYKTGEMYCHGIGVSQNRTLGIQWLELAKLNGSKDAEDMLQKVQSINYSFQPISQTSVSDLVALPSSPTLPTQTITQSSVLSSSSVVQQPSSIQPMIGPIPQNSETFVSHLNENPDPPQD